MNERFLSNHNGNSCIGDVLEGLFNQAEEEIFIVAPYITKNQIINNFVSLKAKTIKILTRLSFHDFVTSASDISIILNLIRDKRTEVRYFSNLHAKIYLFDRKQAFVTSANFTANGLYHNLEYGVLTCEDIEPLSQDLSALWNEAEIVDENLLLKIMNELSAANDKKEVAAKVRYELSAIGNEIIKKNISHKIKSKKIQATNQEKMVFAENDALGSMISYYKFEKEDSEKVRLVYELIKMNIPKEIREICSFRYRFKRFNVDIACNIMNYRLFLFPYRNNIVQLIYPREEVSKLTTILSRDHKRINDLEKWIFKSCDCDILFFTFDEILLLEPIQWESFGIACNRAFNAKKTRLREGNIVVNWDIRNDVFFYINSTRGSKAKGKLVNRGFLVLKGSIAAKEIAPSFPTQQYYESYQKLIMDKVLIESNNQLVFTKDYKFNSPSEAASVVMGRNATGQSEWKLVDGTCLKDYFQKNKGI